MSTRKSARSASGANGARGTGQIAFLVALAAAAIGVCAAACATATGTISGGEAIFDASVPLVTGVEGGTTNCIIGDDAGTGSGWADLYRDFFGPTGRASCTGDGQCHGAANSAGTLGSGGFQCGADQAACRQSMLDTKLLHIPADESSPQNSGLIIEIRKVRSDGTLDGLMPLRPACVAFSGPAVQRVEDWIKGGAPDN